MFHVHEGTNTPAVLRFGYDVLTKGGLSGGFGAEDFGHAAARHATNTVVIVTNQLRQKIGVYFGNPETTTGGRALKFYASVRIDIRR
ncbi:MAG: hypothetical protein P8Z41_16045, partial [Anaerolineales bacterium]